MIIKILGNKDSQAYKIAEACVREKGHRVWNESTGVYDLAIAPLLTEKVSVEVLKESLYGTLIFHPSPLPYGRGASSSNGLINAKNQSLPPHGFGQITDSIRVIYVNRK